MGAAVSPESTGELGEPGREMLSPWAQPDGVQARHRYHCSATLELSFCLSHTNLLLFLNELLQELVKQRAKLFCLLPEMFFFFFFFFNAEATSSVLTDDLHFPSKAGLLSVPM